MTQPEDQSLMQRLINIMFDDKGKLANKLPIELYFNGAGELIAWEAISKTYHNYPANSDIVKMYYAHKITSEIRDDYRAFTLFIRLYQ